MDGSSDADAVADAESTVTAAGDRRGVAADVASPSDPDPDSNPDPDPVELSAAYLRAVRTDAPLESHERAIATLPETALDALDATERKAVWLNVYNAATQAVLDAAPEQYEARTRFFSAPIVRVAGHDRSLNDIEHGLLRSSALSWGLGYLSDPWPDGFERRHRVPLDPRIHFALNCGAVSCPPIAAYSRSVETELDMAAGGYLTATVEHDPAAGTVRVPRVMLWYIGDFGGPGGVRDTLKEYDCIPGDASPRLRFREWDWSLSRKDFADAA